MAHEYTKERCQRHIQNCKKYNNVSQRRIKRFDKYSKIIVNNYESDVVEVVAVLRLGRQY